MKKQSLLLVGWLLLATSDPLQAQFSYVTNNGTITITNYTGTNAVVVIPDTITGRPVTAIGFQAFVRSTNLISVIIPNSITSIADEAFAFTGLTNVTVPNSVIKIGPEVFEGCTNLTNILVDPLNSAYSSVDGVLFNQSKTTLVEYPSGKVGSYTILTSVTSIEDGAFSGCTGLTSVTISNSVMGFSEFSGCTSLTNVTIGNSVTSIEDGAFSGCIRLTSVTIPTSVTSIAGGAFIGCTGLTRVTIGSDVTSIGGEAFQDCTSLISITIPNSVTSIGGSAFANCTSLTSVTIGNSVTNIGGLAFTFCTKLASVFFMGNAPYAEIVYYGTPPNLTLPYFVFNGDNATAYYLPGTTGWGSTFGGVPTAFWTLPSPLILNKTAGFGVQSNGFGFTISWATNASVVVEASPDLNNPKWSSIITNALSGGTLYFSDPDWAKYPIKFYRVRSQ